ncbi:MAG: type I restriction enzyme HsdR N-terminal domain-containing protein [Bacteroidales bacterium]|nr:type I restriction enzyme HsdR N-terminal domain-containing protein [Bacteroidales bacterium]MBN2748350.1 type I restriction enzyme HsdR N-terminal domain-containing protein [Bacteroidales bacterium]
MLPVLNLPAFDIKTRVTAGNVQVFDICRGKYVALTPEEWVRQHFLNYLLTCLDVPKGVMAVEHPIEWNGMSYRADIVVFSRQGKPLLVVECKAPTVELSQETFVQAARYNFYLKAPLLAISNGGKHFFAKVDLIQKRSEQLSALPNYAEMILLAQ